MGLELDVDKLEEDDHSLSSYDDERTQFILSSSESNLHTQHSPRSASAIILPMMANPQVQENGRNNKDPIVVGNPLPVTENDDNHTKSEGRRKSSSQSIISNAHTQLQMLVEDVKEELKELASIGSNNNNNNNYSKTDVEKVGDTKVKGKGDKEKTVRTGWKRYIGIILAITSSMFFALCILIVKYLANDYHPYSTTFWRFQGVLLPTLPIIFYYRIIKKQPIFDMICPASAPGNRKTLLFVLLRCITGASAVVLQFYSLQYINMADSSVIAFSTPVFVSLASHVFLGEKSGFIPVICGVITLFGVAVITRPPILTGGEAFDTNTLIGAGMALGCMFCAASTFLLLRYLRQLHFSVITMFFGFWGSFQSVALSATISKFQVPVGLEHWMLAIALASLTFLGQTCITLAFKFEQAGTVSLCRTFDIIFAYVWQFLFLGVVPDMYSFIGGGIVMLGVLLAAFRKYLSELPPDSTTRNAFWIILK